MNNQLLKEDSIASANTIPIEVYPTPSTTEVTIAYKLARETPVSLYLIDEQGQVVQNMLNNKVMAEGTHKHIPSSQKWRILDSAHYAGCQIF